MTAVNEDPTPTMLSLVLGRIIAPLLLGAAIGASITYGLGAISRRAEVVAVLVLCAVGIVWGIRELRWIRRQKAQMIADRERLEAMLKGRYR